MGGLWFKSILVVAFLALDGLLLAPLPVTLATNYNYKPKYVETDNKLPTIYEFFRNSAVSTQGLTAEGDSFRLNGKRLKIISGAMHYFRIHPNLWRDRIKKLRAMGANTLETYVPWQLHEPKMGEFDFGQGDNGMSIFLDLRQYLQIAQEEDLLVLLRPGPYICGEWDFGGLPSWLQRDPEMKVRTNYEPYLNRVKIYFDKLLPLVADLQFTRGGPIIGVQLENEYGTFNKISKEYLEFLYNLYEVHGISNETLIFTSDNIGDEDTGTLPEKLLMTVNFQGEVHESFARLKELQPRKPLMATEFWTGWYDHWSEKHHTLGAGAYVDILDNILGKWNASVNLYMFHGGTNFGFMAGANKMDKAPYYDSDVTSYDYDSPLTEAGDYTTKYYLSKALIDVYQEPRIAKTEMIPESVKTAYPSIEVQRYLTYNDIIAQVPKVVKLQSKKPLSMENLSINDGNGQSYGYIIYRKVANISNGDNFEAGPVKDLGVVLLDGRIQSKGFQNYSYWINTVENVSLTVESFGEEHVLDLLIENMARVNYGNDQDFLQQKGLQENATYQLNGQDITNIEIIPLEFKSEWVQSLTHWKLVSDQTILPAPVLIQSYLTITNEPTDTFLDMSSWYKGIVFVNGFNIGRYFRAGPQHDLYLPAPILRKGVNTITIFEQFEASRQIVFKDKRDTGPLSEAEWKLCRV